MRPLGTLVAAVVMIACPLGQTFAPAADEKAGIEFFEAKIRPVLVDQCFKCHSATAKKVKGKLKLDTKEDFEKGGENGKIITPGDPEKSTLITAIRYKDEDLQMPPKEKLPDNVIKDFEQWVKMGAPYPALEGKKNSPAAEAPQADPRDFWSFKKPVSHAPPAVTNPGWVQSPIDSFILAKLEEHHLAPAPKADKRTLIRRATFDLTGLPPTPAEVQAFLRDDSPDAFAHVIDRLLASPHYGERWGRYWLDVARYADTKGYVFEEERRYPFSYTYRDWVVKALNEDMPYDQFLINQIAADLVTPRKTENLAAEGFLLLGRRFLNVQADVIDDRLDVLMRGTQAMTLTCARCHDHKFDPITQKDYYGLYGVFASSTEPAELPLLEKPKPTPETMAFEKELAAKQGEIEKFLDQRYGQLLKELKSEKEIAAYLMAAHEVNSGPGEQVRAVASKRALRPHGIERWVAHLKGNDPLFALWKALEAVPEGELAKKSADIVAGQKDLDAKLAEAFKGAAVKSLQEVADRYGKALAGRDLAPLAIARGDVQQLFLRDDHSKLRELKKRVEAFEASSPGAPPRAMVMADLPTPVEPHVFKRGNPNMPGEAVRRQYIAILRGPDAKPFSKGSGRLELAQAIASKENPLTARVIVNRVWLGHFGQGLVRTPSDFGTRGDRPTHPELLDQLAVDFMNDGWSLKKLHRKIMLSATYQQSSDYSAADYAVDPDNRLLSHQNRRRLDFEATRDALLFASGQLDLTIGGHAIDISNPDARRRTMYGFIDRQNLPGMFRAFDFASPDTTSPQRYSTTVPQQALFLMNSPFVIEQARALVNRPDVRAISDEAEKVRQLYQDLFQREPRADERSLALGYLKVEEQQPAPSIAAPKLIEPTWKYGYGWVDEKTGKVHFTPLPQFVDGAWRGGAKLPDEKLGWCVLNGVGGHPGNDQEHAVIRRFVAPRDCSLAVSVQLNHPGEVGDGVRGRIVSSERVMATITARHSTANAKVELTLKKGSTVDFVVDCRSGPNTDSFSSTVAVHIHGPASEGQRKDYNSASDFSSSQSPTQAPPPPAPLSPWEKYAQVLLLSNEFVFVD